MGECLSIASRLARIVARYAALEGCDCVLLSGGIDTSFVATAVAAHAPGLVRLAVSVLPEGSPDEAYAHRVSEALGLRLAALRPSTPGFRAAVDASLVALGIVDPVEVAGAAGAALGLAAARSEGCGCVLTGDGGDELFLGYEFLLNAGPREIGEWRARMTGGGAHFVVDDLAGVLGVRVCHPLYSPEARLVAREAPLECLISRGPGGSRVGKYLLRLYLDAMGLPWVAWRGKTPITMGSGALGLLEGLARGSRPVEGWEPSEAHAYLMARMLDLGLEPPGPCPDPGRRCPVCGRCLEGGRCRFCGAYLGGGGVSVYRGQPRR